VLRADHHESELLIGRPSAARVTPCARRRSCWSAADLVVLDARQEGNVLVWDRGEVLIPLADVAVVDTTGAGDSFVAGLARGAGLQQAGPLATAAAALTVGRLGGRPNLSAVGLVEQMARMDGRSWGP
jgi:ribokinase